MRNAHPLDGEFLNGAEDREAGYAGRERKLRAQVDAISNTLSRCVDGTFDFHVRIDGNDETLEKLQMVTNFLLDAARRAMAGMEEKNAALAESFESLASMQQELRQRETLLRAIVDSSANPIITLDDEGVIHSVSDSAERVFGWTSEELTGENVALLVATPPPDTEAESFDPASIAATPGVPREFAARRKDGTTFSCEISMARVDTEAVEHPLFAGTLSDVSHRKELEEELRRLSWKDSLTGIGNRRAFDDTLEREARRANRNGSPLSLLLMDVDMFKAYNDTLGHQQGDTCLVSLAAIMRGALKRPDDVVARYGGEEFAVILPETPADGSIKVAERMRKAIEAARMPHPASDVSPCVTVSIGCATMVAGSPGGVEMLLSAADKALYSAKERGRNRWVAAGDYVARSQ